MLTLLFSGCSYRWEKIDDNLVDDKLGFFFNLNTAEQFFYMDVKDGKHFIEAQCKTNRDLCCAGVVERFQRHYDKVDAKIVEIIKKIVSIGKYKGRRDLHKYDDVAIRKSNYEPQMMFCSHGHGCYEWYMDSKGMKEAGMQTLYAEMNEYLYSLFPELKDKPTVFPYSINPPKHRKGKVPYYDWERFPQGPPKDYIPECVQKLRENGNQYWETPQELRDLNDE